MTSTQITNGEQRHGVILADIAKSAVTGGLHDVMLAIDLQERHCMDGG